MAVILGGSDQIIPVDAGGCETVYSRCVGLGLVFGYGVIQLQFGVASFNMLITDLNWAVYRQWKGIKQWDEEQ
ncbi:hypothetical protein BYT27DRAFT_7205960, partial [Phlegmacium glaucopus]